MQVVVISAKWPSLPDVNLVCRQVGRLVCDPGAPSVNRAAGSWVCCKWQTIPLVALGWLSLVHLATVSSHLSVFHCDSD